MGVGETEGTAMPEQIPPDAECASREELDSTPSAALAANVLELLHALNTEHQRLVRLCAGEEQEETTNAQD
jgi:hypothetical protein